MTERNRWQTLAGVLLVSAFVLVILTPAAMAQEEPETQSEQTVSQTATAPPPPPKPGPDPGPFKKGKVRVGFYAGAGNTLSQTYFIIGGGVGYYILNGLEAGVDVEGWVLQDPTFWKVTPQVRYVIWQLNPIRPYVGAFWRKTFSGENYPDYNSWGARGGVAYRKGGSYVAVGVVYEKYDDYTVLVDDYVVYPEIAFWLSF
jgi:hypothetical protein